MKKTDQYGNNTDFSDDVMSDMTTKGLLGKWTSMLLNKVRYALSKYYMKHGNIDAGDKDFVVAIFNDVNNKISILTPVLEDLVDKNIYGIEDISVAVYGISSNEAYLLREFERLTEEMSSWNEGDMWNDCRSDTRLEEILN